MSDSDDTEILLLIPPDFFVIQTSDTESSTYEDDRAERSVVNDLISHVNELENRITQIEWKDTALLNESMQSMNSSLSSNFLPSEMNRATGHLGSDPSINVSPSRRGTRFNSLPPTPSSSSYRSFVPSSRTWNRNNSSPSKAILRSHRNSAGSSWDITNDDKVKGNNLLSEVDMFLDGLKRDSTSSKSNREKELLASAMQNSPQKKDTASAVAHLQLDEVDRLLKEVEAEQKSIEARLSSHDSPEVRKIVKKPGETVGSIPDLGFGVRDQWKDVDHFLQRERNQQPVVEGIVTARKQYQLGDNIGSIPDLGFGVRETWASPTSAKQNKNVLQSKPYLQTDDAPIVPQAATVLQSESNTLPKQSPKVFASRRKLDLDHHMKQRPAAEDSVEQDTVTSLESFPSSTDQTGAMRNKRAAIHHLAGENQLEDLPLPSKTLLSLAELWSDGEGPTLRGTGDSKLLQKYEEERCRRQHCEQLVQALQTKLLEAQQKLAVALQVDCDKDAAISKLQGAWNSLAKHWRSLEEQRHSLTQQLQDQKLRSDSQIKQMHEKMERYETELSKALDLAHGYKEQSDAAEHAHRLDMEQLVSKVQELECSLAASTLSCSEGSKREEALRKQVNEDHKKLAQLQAAMDEATKALTSQEADVAVLAEEKSALQNRLREEKARLETHQLSKEKMHVDLEELKKREKHLQTELKKSSEQLEVMKTELHDFYQAQLERVVRDKLKEFQAQLDAAESALQRELENRERNVAQLAARQLQHVTEKHKLEVSLLEQKHGEELRLMQLQLSKASRQIRELETRLSAHEKHSSNLAERLHGVMENQWREALSIISNPNEKDEKLQSSTMTLDKQVLGRNGNGKDTAWMLVQQQQQHQKQSHSQSSSHSSMEDTPFSRDGQVTHRTATPVQLQQNQTEDSDDLRKYIKMLLDRAPGNPIDPEHYKVFTGGKNSQASGSANNASQLKPPWK